MKLPLTLKRVAKATESRRPQTPQRPYPYDEIEVTYENKADGVTLAGALTLPRSKGPFPVALLISGSGPQDRDETLLGHKPFLVLADHLTRRGIAVLRVDDRGVGGSTGKVRDATSADFARDVLGGVEFLKSRKDVNAAQIGLIGHSEGGIIAPLVASRSKDIAFIVMLAGTGLPGDEVLYAQGEAILKVAGADAEQLAREKALQQRMFTLLRAEKDPAVAEKKLRAALEELTAKLSKEEQKRRWRRCRFWRARSRWCSRRGFVISWTTTPDRRCARRAVPCWPSTATRTCRWTPRRTCKRSKPP